MSVSATIILINMQKDLFKQIRMIYSGCMNLNTYFQITTPTEREEFAKKVGTSVGYLYLCTRTPKKGKPRQPGPDLCKRMVKEDSRFTLAELRPDIWGNGVTDSISATDDVQPPVGGIPKKAKRSKKGG